MLQVESCIELYCYAGCILSSRQMPLSTTRSPPASGAPRGSPARQASRPAPPPKPGNAPFNDILRILLKSTFSKRPPGKPSRSRTKTQFLCRDGMDFRQKRRTKQTHGFSTTRRNREEHNNIGNLLFPDKGWENELQNEFGRASDRFRKSEE